MKKISILAIALLFVFSGFSQDLEQINEMMGQNNFKEAKAAIDKYLQNPQKANDAEALYYKGRIYNTLSRDSSTNPQDILTYKNESFESFKRNQQLDTKDLYLTMEGHVSYLDIYFGLYELGANEFNNKNYEGALASFKKAEDVKDYILSKKYEYTQAKLYPIDTSLVLNIAASAIQAKKEEVAISYYQKLADANISGKDYKDVYEYMVDYYSRKDDAVSLKAIMEKAKRFYPESDSWTEIEINAIAKKGDKNLLYAKYEELIEKDPSNFRLAYNYSVNLYNSLYGRDANEVKDPIVSDKLIEILKKAIANEKADDISATVLMSTHLFNRAAEFQNAAIAIKGNKPDDVKKRNELKVSANKNMDECIVYSDNAVKFHESIESKTPAQKANYKIVLSYLIDIYNLKNNKAKAAEYEKKNAAADH